MLKVLSLFSGIGMFDYGLEKAGMKTIAFCEIDPAAQNILRKHWPNTPIFPDINNLKGSDIGPVDVIVGGYPCTGHSVAGLKKGLDNEESKLWTQYRRLIQEIQPKYIIIENSANLRTTGLGQVIKDLGEIGYMGEWHIIPSAAVGGVSRRERIYIIAYRDGVRLFEETDASKEEKQKWWAETRTRIGSEWAGESEPGRIYPGHTEGLDERRRKARIKLCGMSLDWRIPFLIGSRILERKIN
jgi:DNA-cytosine methyltransferase